MCSLQKYVELTRNAVCWDCGRPLNATLTSIKVKEHSDGWEVEGFPQKQWLYYECSHCLYQTSFFKLGIKRPRP